MAHGMQEVKQASLFAAQGHAQAPGLGWGGFPLGALGAGACFGVAGLPARGASALAKSHDGAAARARASAPDALELHRLQSGAGMPAGATELHRLQSGAGALAGAAELFRLQSGAGLLAGPAELHRLPSGTSSAVELQRLQSVASSRAGGAGGPRVSFRRAPPAPGGCAAACDRTCATHASFVLM